MTKISVIVPVYKVEDHIGRCIESILSQTYREFELILVDDGSPDNSGVICDEYAQKDARIRVFHKENGGVSSARNYGIEKATGDWLCFIDSDDYIGKTYLEDFHLTDDIYNMPIQGFGIQRKDSYEIHSIPVESKSQSDIFYQAELLNILNSPCYKLFSTDLIRKNELIYDSNTSYGEDHIFVMNYMRFIKTIQGNIGHSYTYNQTTEVSLTRRKVPRKYLIYYIETIVSLLESNSKKFGLSIDQMNTVLNKRIYRHWIKLLFSFAKDSEINKEEFSDIIRRLKMFRFSTVGLSGKNSVILGLLYYMPNSVIWLIIKMLRYQYQ